MKKICVLMLIFSLLFGTFGCNTVEEGSTNATDTEEISNVIDISHLLSPDYVKSPYFDLDETDPSPSDAMIGATIENIRSEQYESYPSLQTIPLSATLYKDGEVKDIALDDPRLIRLINFFNNALHYDKCAYLLCYVTEEILAEDVMSDDFRLELKFKPFGDVKPAPYDDNPSDFDTMIITNRFLDFTLINSTTPIYTTNNGVKEVEIPFFGAMYGPYFNCKITLADFGF